MEIIACILTIRTMYARVIPTHAQDRATGLNIQRTSGAGDYSRMDQSGRDSYAPINNIIAYVRYILIVC